MASAVLRHVDEIQAGAMLLLNRYFLKHYGAAVDRVRNVSWSAQARRSQRTSTA